MSEHKQTLAPATTENAVPNAIETAVAGEPQPITEQEVGEYREQDRFLPVRPVILALSL